MKSKICYGHVELFTAREEKLLASAAALRVTLPDRLKNWRQWIGDSAIYLNELANLIAETAKKTASQ